MKDLLLNTPASEGHQSGPSPGKISFHSNLLQTLPDLRGFARFLTRDAVAADDLVQDTIVRALASQDQFQQGTVLKAWLFTIQRNAFYEQTRRRSREQEIMLDIELDMQPSTAAPSRQTARAAVQDLGELLWKLPDLVREALLLVGGQGLSYEAAAPICDVPTGTMRARVSRARARLAELASENTDDPEPDQEKKTD